MVALPVPCPVDAVTVTEPAVADVTTAVAVLPTVVAESGVTVAVPLDTRNVTVVPSATTGETVAIREILSLVGTFNATVFDATSDTVCVTGGVVVPPPPPPPQPATPITAPIVSNRKRFRSPIKVSSVSRPGHFPAYFVTYLITTRENSRHCPYR
ncbi:hypothetical protein [Geobacter sp. AOG1]|uniref:hypothetical protein n=1 Tax=Geobacter sp. AOG1 TaxID=1566346 RepID=UPI001CC7B9EA|nr:hypothetical protein [Geobacter sp. AOG1]